MAEYAMETPRITNKEEIQDSVFHGKGDAVFFLGLKKGLYWKSTWKRGVLLFVPLWYTLVAGRPTLHCHSSKETDAIMVKL
jgi:hypothetical protein